MGRVAGPLLGPLLVLLLGFVLAGCGASRGGAGGGVSSSLECAPFARQVSGLQLYGDAASWWEQAAGRYQRGAEPAHGGVLVFRRTGRLPHGHVSVVTERVSDREIRVAQANWVHGRVGRDEPVRDVSANNDWTQVRVWWAPSRGLGTTVYPTFGFVGPGRAGADMVAEAPE